MNRPERRAHQCQGRAERRPPPGADAYPADSRVRMSVFYHADTPGTRVFTPPQLPHEVTRPRNTGGQVIGEDEAQRIAEAVLRSDPARWGKHQVYRVVAGLD